MLAGPLANLILGWMTLASLVILAPVILAKIELGFIASLTRRQCVLMSQQFFGQGLESGLDVVLHKRLLDSVPVQDAPLLQTWWQGLYNTPSTRGSVFVRPAMSS